MLVSYKWLKELVDVDVTTYELSEKMSTTGIEVEGVSTPSEGLTKLVVGHVVSCEDVQKHICTFAKWILVMKSCVKLSAVLQM